MSFNSDVAIGVLNNILAEKRRKEREEAAKQALRDDANTGRGIDAAEDSNESTGKEQTDSDRSS